MPGIKKKFIVYCMWKELDFSLHFLSTWASPFILIDFGRYQSYSQCPSIPDCESSSYLQPQLPAAPEHSEETVSAGDIVVLLNVMAGPTKCFFSCEATLDTKQNVTNNY